MKKKRRKRRDEGNKSEWNREREGVLLMGFDGRQSYERVAAQSDSLGCSAAANAAQREGGMVFALISYSATIVGNATP